jgi:F-type H+-transporting ATPase subunit gamma
MASLRQIRRRIRSIQSTKQIMRAMQLVSGSKFKRAQTRLQQGRQMLAFLDEMLQRVLAAAPKFQHPLTQANPAAASTLVIVTSDTGLAGSYNTNIIQLAEAELRKDTAKHTEIVYIGKKGHRYFTKRGFPAKEAVLDQAGRPDATRIDMIGKTLMDRFLTGHTSGVRLLYAKFQSSSLARPIVKQWLPIALTAAPTEEAKAAPEEYLFEPSAQRVLEDLLPRWAIAAFRLSLLEAFTAEHSARMIAMKNATDNAQEIMTSLTRERNKIRQASITKELSEIVGTVEALK